MRQVVNYNHFIDKELKCPVIIPKIIASSGAVNSKILSLNHV